MGSSWASYFSVFVFSFVHSMPTLLRISLLEVGVPLGPLLLGGICEILYQKTGRLLPCILFHAICNFSVVLYSMIDPRWLSWFEGLYL